MRNIWNLIVYSFSPNGLFRDILEEAEFIHFKIALTLLAFLPILLAEFILNILNCGLWIIFLAAAVSFIVAFAATRPKILAEIAAIGAALPEGKKATQGIRDISSLYFSLMVKILLWFNLISVFMATMPVKSFPMGFPLVIFSLFIIGLMSIAWQLEIKYAKKIAYAYVVGTIIVGVALCVPRATYLNWIAFYPFEHMITSETAKVLSDIDEAEAVRTDTNNADALKKIEEKIIDGKALGSGEKDLLDRLRRERKENTLPRKVANGASATVDGIKGLFTSPPPSSTIAGQHSQEIGWKELEISLSSNEEYEIDNLKAGAAWKYVSFNGVFKHRVDKGDGRACWKRVDNAKPWKSEWAGKLQVKAGDQPVKLIVLIKEA